MTGKLNGQSKVRIAILGHRGIPNSYGGFETLAEELSSRLVELGAQVVVYCRKNYFDKRPATHRGATLVYLPTVAKKSLDTLFHTFISVLHVVLYNTADVLIIVNVGNAPLALLAKLFGKKVIFCVDGLDWQRKKWGSFARWYLKICSYFAGIVSNQVVTDAASVFDFYKQNRSISSAHIPYGTEIETDYTGADTFCEELGLQPKKYFIYVARFEPENNPLFVVQSYVKSGSKLPLVMVGDNRYNKEYVNEIKAAANNQVIFTSYLFGARYKTLVKNSLAYIRSAEVGGISPAVVEAMGRAVCVIANDKSENREPLASTGVYYDLNNQESLVAAFKDISENQQKAIDLGKKSAQRAMLTYSWDKIAFDYFKLAKKVTAYSESESIEHIRSAEQGKKRMLITGAGGMFGSIAYTFFANTYAVRATTVHPTEAWQTKLDTTNYAEFETVVKLFKPDYILHLAAMTDLEVCEKSLPLAYAANALSAKYAAQLSARYGAKLIYTSTANIFDGKKPYYVEEDPAVPLHVYGLTKHMGELLTQYYTPNNLIIRFGWLVGGGKKYDKKFVGKIIDQITRGKKEINAVTDKIGSITYAPDAVAAIKVLIEKNAVGTYHLVSNGFASRYEIAKYIVNQLGYNQEVAVNPVSSSFFDQVYSIERPKNECLINKRLTMEGMNTMRPWEVALSEYLSTDYAAMVKKNKVKPVGAPSPALA